MPHAPQATRPPWRSGTPPSGASSTSCWGSASTWPPPPWCSPSPRARPRSTACRWEGGGEAVKGGASRGERRRAASRCQTCVAIAPSSCTHQCLQVPLCAGPPPPSKCRFPLPSPRPQEVLEGLAQLGEAVLLEFVSSDGEGEDAFLESPGAAAEAAGGSPPGSPRSARATAGVHRLSSASTSATPRRRLSTKPRTPLSTSEAVEVGHTERGTLRRGSTTWVRLLPLCLPCRLPACPTRPQALA